MEKAKRYPVVMTIAGSDSGGCAGIQADLKTISSLGLFGTSVITSITAQNTTEVRAVEVLSSEIVRKQLEAVFDDIVVDAVKTGMLPSAEIIEAVSEAIDKYRLGRVVVDPVMVATSGARLASSAVGVSMREHLYRKIALITPNIPEAEALSGIEIGCEDDMRRAGEVLLEQGCRAVLIKGGHRFSGTKSVADSDMYLSTDMLFTADREPVAFSSPRVDSRNLHGTGCTFSSAITSFLALGNSLEDAIALAKHYITAAINNGMEACMGKGFGPVNHFFDPKPPLIIIEK